MEFSILGAGESLLFISVMCALCQTREGYWLLYRSIKNNISFLYVIFNVNLILLHYNAAFTIAHIIIGITYSWLTVLFPISEFYKLMED